MGLFNTSKDMGIDLGTANTLIYLAEKGIVLNEPSVIAVEKYTGKLLATGLKAKEMIGRAPSNIDVVRPLEDGVISNFDMTVEMLKDFIYKALHKKAGTINIRAVVGVPSGVTEVEKRAVEDTIRQMGGKEVFILEEPMAAAIGAGLDVNDPSGCMVADIGGGTTDIAIIALGGIVSFTSIRHAGDKFNEAIIQYMRRVHALHIGEQMAENLKIHMGCAMVDSGVRDEDREYMEAKGRDAVSGLPKVVLITQSDMQAALEDSIEIVVEGIRSTLEVCPPELAADIVTNGLVLAGGGSMLHNLDKLIASRTGMDVRVADNAFEAVVLGAGASLGNTEWLKSYVNNRRRR